MGSDMGHNSHLNFKVDQSVQQSSNQNDSHSKAMSIQAPISYVSPRARFGLIMYVSSDGYLTDQY